MNNDGTTKTWCNAMQGEINQNKNLKINLKIKI